MKFLIYIFPFLALAVANNEDAHTQLVKGNEQFTANMFNVVAKSHPGESVVLSGFSALSPLAQLGLASVGDSHDEVLKAIGLPNDEVTKEAFSVVNKKLRSVQGVELKVANRVYVKTGQELNETFATLSRDVFDSDVKSVDFSQNQQAAATINAFVEENTNKRIKDLVDPKTLDGTTSAVLVNAIYFKGNWQNEFNKNLTKDRDFHVTKDKTVKVPTMFSSGSYLYGESEELQAKLLEVPYKGGEASFLVVLPNKVDGLEALQKELRDPSKLANAVKDMRYADVDVYLPKFKIETKVNLKDVLQQLGVKELFTSEAKLPYLLKGNQRLYISDAVQKAFIEVNEEGAEAAAASAVFAYFSAPVPPKPFVAEHPFVFLLKDGDNILFTGAVHC